MLIYSQRLPAEKFFSNDLEFPLPEHALAESPCRDMIGKRSISFLCTFTSPCSEHSLGTWLNTTWNIIFHSSIGFYWQKSSSSIRRSSISLVIEHCCYMESIKRQWLPHYWLSRYLAFNAHKPYLVIGEVRYIQISATGYSVDGPAG